MKPEKVFKRYDIRGKYPEEIDEEFAELLGKALGTFVKKEFKDEVIVCRDNKESSKPLQKALMNGLKSTGHRVIDVGIGPTDFAAYAGNERGAVSIQVTSSHMPLEFNGFKFMYPEGNGFVNEDLNEVERIFREKEFDFADGYIDEDKEAINRYEEELVVFAHNFSDDFNRKIVVDSLGGTAEILPRLLKELGAEVTDLNNRDGIYADPPNPKPDNLERLAQKVEEEDADIGIANDLDADRITIYYDGKFLNGNDIFSILAQLFEDPFVASIDTSKALEEFGEVEYTRVGDPFVMDKAVEIGAELAGEPNGHYAFIGFVPYSSGLLAALILSGIELDEKLEKISEYRRERKTVESERKHEKMKEVKEEIAEKYEIESEIDGLKYSYGNASLLIRPSGTSPKIRIIGESQNRQELKEAMQESEKIVRNA